MKRCALLIMLAGIAAAQSGVWVTPEAEAVRICQKLVGERLKAPASAKFAPEKDTSVTGPSDYGSYTVVSYVDSQNGFGAMLRTRFSCEIRKDSRGLWSLVGVSLK